MKYTAERMNTYKDLSCLGNAARRKWGHILSRAMLPSSRSFFKRNHLKENLKGLDLFCGTGEITMQLNQILGPTGSLCGLDIDTTSIEIARDKDHASSKTLAFLHLNRDNWCDSVTFDFIYCRSFLNPYYTPSELFDRIYSSLRPGGFLLLEHIDLSKLQCFPQNYAFDRTLELYTALNQAKGIHIDSAIQLNTLMQKVQFQKIQMQQISPAFLSEDSKSIASLSLERIATQLVENKLARSSELQALLAELKTLEKQKTTLISLPSIYQVIGHK